MYESASRLELTLTMVDLLLSLFNHVLSISVQMQQNLSRIVKNFNAVQEDRGRSLNTTAADNGQLSKVIMWALK